MSSLSHLIQRADDTLNPIVVKELRQAVRGRFLAATLILFLVVQLIAIAFFLMFQRDEVVSGFNAGSQLFMVLLSILLAVSLLFVPLYTSLRLANERSDTYTDLIYITTIRPTSIIWGKFLSAVVLTVLLFSVSLPFMTLTYLLRGIDLPTIFVVMGFAFLMILLSVPLLMLFACLPVSRVLKVFLGLVGLGMLFQVFVGSIAAGSMMTSVGSLAGTWGFWGWVAAFLAVSALFVGLCFVLAVAMISPHSANRGLLVRGYITGGWVVGATVFAILVQQTGDAMALLPGLSAIVFILCLALLAGVSEREELGTRIRRTIPRRPILRALAFPLYSGSGAGVLWATLMLAVSLLLAWYWVDLQPGLRNIDEFQDVFWYMAVLSLYTFAYAVTALLIQHYLLGGILNKVYTWTLALLLISLASILPILLSFLLNSDIGRAMPETWLIGCPLAWPMVDEANQPLFFTFAAAWSGFAAALALPWFFGQVSRFTPVDASPPRTHSSDAAMAEVSRG